MLEDLEKRIEELIDKLFKENSGKPSCPNIRRDEKGPYCSKDMESENPELGRRLVCDNISLQLWCLNKDYQKCIHYQGKEFPEYPIQNT